MRPGGYHHTPETKAKMSAALKGKPSPHRGKTLSPEQRAKLSAARKGWSPSPETRAKISAALTGRSHAGYRKLGDRWIDKKGYIWLFQPNHPRARVGKPYVNEHILVWEKANGCLLPPKDIIHHLNGIKSDNRIENLVRMDRSSHQSIHINERNEYIKALQSRILELEEVIFGKV